MPLSTINISRVPRAGVCLFLALGFVAAQVDAALIAPSQWTRPTNDAQASASLTTYQEWNVFVDADGAHNPEGSVDLLDAINYPDVAEINPNTTLNDPANLVDTTPDRAFAYDTNYLASGSFLTGSGNIYSPGVVIFPRAVVPGYGNSGATRFLVQVQSRGALIDTTLLTLDGVSVSTLPGYSYTQLSSTLLGPPGQGGGNAVEHAWTFTAPADQTSFTLDWGWGVASASFANLAIDTQVVPEPSSLGLAAVGALGLAWLARRRNADRRSHSR